MIPHIFGLILREPLPAGGGMTAKYAVNSLVRHDVPPIFRMDLEPELALAGWAFPVDIAIRILLDTWGNRDRHAIELLKAPDRFFEHIFLHHPSVCSSTNLTDIVQSQEMYSK